MLVPINNDIFSISQRLKEIDENYYIMYNTEKGKYEVHHSAQYGGTYCLTLPYKTLDARAVEHVKSTRREYIDNVVNEIERNNRKLSGCNSE